MIRTFTIATLMVALVALPVVGQAFDAVQELPRAGQEGLVVQQGWSERSDQQRPVITWPQVKAWPKINFATTPST